MPIILQIIWCYEYLQRETVASFFVSLLILRQSPPATSLIQNRPKLLMLFSLYKLIHNGFLMTTKKLN